MAEFDIADNDIVRNFTIVVPPETFEFDKTIYSFRHPWLHSQVDTIAGGCLTGYSEVGVFDDDLAF